MMAKKPTKPRAKAGASAVEAARRRSHFVLIYLSNGGNATQAAIDAGFTPHRPAARVQAHQLMQEPAVKAAIEAKQAEIDAKVGLDAEKTMRKLAAIAYGDIGELYDDDGNLRPLKELCADQRLLLHKLDHDVTRIDVSRDGETETKTVTSTRKVEVKDQLRALDMAMRHHGLYDKDNRQRGESISVNVILED